VSDGLTENDLLDYARTITNKVSENEAVMHQIRGMGSAWQAWRAWRVTCSVAEQGARFPSDWESVP
jgi:hypothetical protein